MGEFKAIKTRYKGYACRSRLEARWCVYFDAIGLEWEYEREGFEFDGLRYLPDFWLPQVQMWAEVKAEPLRIEEIVKTHMLTKFTGFPCIQLVGVPECKGYPYVQWSEEVQAYEYFDCMLSMHKDYPTTERRFYSSLGGTYEEIGGAAMFPDVLPAVNAARSARFEFGQEGAQR